MNLIFIDTSNADKDTAVWWEGRAGRGVEEGYRFQFLPHYGKWEHLFIEFRPAFLSSGVPNSKVGTSTPFAVSCDPGDLTCVLSTPLRQSGSQLLRNGAAFWAHLGVWSVNASVKFFQYDGKVLHDSALESCCFLPAYSPPASGTSGRSRWVWQWPRNQNTRSRWTQERLGSVAPI